MLVWICLMSTRTWKIWNQTELAAWPIWSICFMILLKEIWLNDDFTNAELRLDAFDRQNYCSFSSGCLRGQDLLLAVSKVRTRSLVLCSILCKQLFKCVCFDGTRYTLSVYFPPLFLRLKFIKITVIQLKIYVRSIPWDFFCGRYL